MAKSLWAVAIAVPLVMAASSACAQQASYPSERRNAAPGIEVSVTPYLWLPWVSVGARPADRRIPSATSNIDPGELYGHFTWIPFLGEAEFRRDAAGLVIDYIHVPLRAGRNTRGILFNGATANLTLDTGTAMFLYRPLRQKNQYVDVGLGVRAWGLGGQIALNQGALPAVEVANGLSWADPQIAVRYHRVLGHGYSATAYADFGGFGLGAHYDWQLLGTIDYAVSRWIDVHAGFRSLNFSYGAQRANITLNINGPIFSANFRF